MKKKEAKYGPFRVKFSMLTEYGMISPALCLQLVGSVTEEHRAEQHYSAHQLISKYGVSWVLLSLSFEIKQPFQLSEVLFASTWQTRVSEILYRREIGFYREDDSLVAVAAAYYTIIDMSTRSISKCHPLQDIPVEFEHEKLLFAESRYAAVLTGFSNVEIMTIPASWIDMLGHVNNSRYGEMAYNALGDTLQRQLGQCPRMEFYFKRELRKGDQVTLQRRICEDWVEIQGCRNSDNEISFLVRFHFPQI